MLLLIITGITGLGITIPTMYEIIITVIITDLLKGHLIIIRHRSIPLQQVRLRLRVIAVLL
jgi:hypothetical protein